MQKNYREQLLEKIKPAHQKNDEFSLQWLKQNLPNITKYNVDKYKEIIDLVDKIKPWEKFNNEFYVNPLVCECIHGRNHAIRVAIYCLVLNEIHQYGINPDVLIYMGLFHDCSRVDDNKDEGHGERSAQILKTYLLNGLRVNNHDRILYSISVHEKNYPQIEQDNEYKSSEVYVNILKTADALDRYRFPRDDWWIDNKFLKLYPDDLSKKIAVDLVLRSENQTLSDGYCNFDSIIKSLNL